MTGALAAAPCRTGGAPRRRVDTSSAARAFLRCYAGTLAPLLAVLVALELGWERLGGSTGPAATVVVAGWALAAAAWLRARGWTAGAVLGTALAPVAVLGGAAALGWGSPAGLVLWVPVATVLAAATGMSARPVAPEDVRRTGGSAGENVVPRP